MAHLPRIRVLSVMRYRSSWLVDFSAAYSRILRQCFPKKWLNSTTTPLIRKTKRKALRTLSHSLWAIGVNGRRRSCRDGFSGDLFEAFQEPFQVGGRKISQKFPGRIVPFRQTMRCDEAFSARQVSG
jgi:hypothetical protein